MKQEYENYTLSLALFDAVPVILFMACGGAIFARSGSLLFLTGAFLSFLGGLSKVIWKVGLVTQRRDRVFLTKAFRILMILGFFLMTAAALVHRKALFSGETLTKILSFPALLLFGLGAAGMALMGYYAGHLDRRARANWIEEATNAAAQALILAGLLVM